jgi:hypothetical protein
MHPRIESILTLCCCQDREKKRGEKSESKHFEIEIRKELLNY